MKINTFRLLLLISSAAMFSCAGHTRTETDVYTITERDTLYTHHVQNDPGNRDRGIIYPSSKVFKSERLVTQRDSIVKRHYPDFIRLGLFESVGLIGSSSDHVMDVGMFGIFPDYNGMDMEDVNRKNKLFTGGIYRVGIIEQRVRWFNDAKNWTIGTSLVEMIAPEARFEHTYLTVAPIYVRKRYYLREEIPYICVTPAAGFAWFPGLSNYLNLSASLDIGSIGGLNLRAYLGLFVGYNSSNTNQVANSDLLDNDESITDVFPYFGIGISVLDFHNLVPETETEWKDHEHSSWRIGLAQVSPLWTNSEYSYMENVERAIGNGDIPNSGSDLIKGLSFSFANASIALPWFAENKFYLGTSLVNLLVLGNSNWGLGILPVRAGLVQTLVSKELTIEPFIEWNYYPSSFVNFGGKLNMQVSEKFTVGIIAGYASGSTNLQFAGDLSNEFGTGGDISGMYFGINLGLLDQIFTPEELRYNR
ncbi:MAG: hypothetical protein PF588_01050 [Candidatus Kapabacteria bacterium]|jgi:hypothetical protein|nr:hypothetical protein [Candidatus Kapabacteria bacterium]